MADIKLNLEQQTAIEHGEGPLLIVAGAGTGKTLVITHRIAHLINSKMAKPEEILALTFTEKAAAEMTERVDMLLPYGFSNVSISTFHAFGDKILREFALDLGLNPDFQVLSQPEQVIFFRDNIFEFPLKHYRPLSDPTRFILAMLNVISRAKDEDISPERYCNFVLALQARYNENPNDDVLKETYEKQKEVAETYDKFQELMAAAGKVDFGDQVTMVLKLFRQNPSVLKEVQKQYKFILVDEFQDTNFSQFQLIKLLAGENGNITVVGDDDQSIYKFRGAAISNILSFMDVFPNAKQVVLTHNFRSTQVILDTSYRLISNNNPDRLEVKNQIDKKLRAQIQDGAIVEHLHCDALTTEADRVARIIQDFIQKEQYHFNDFAILVRTNNEADTFLRALNLKEIPWRFTGNRGLYTRPEVKLLLAFLKVIANPHDTLYLYALCSSEIYELGSMEDLSRCVHLADKQNRSLYSIIKNLEDDEDLESLSAESISTFNKVVEDIKRFQDLSRDNITGVVLYEYLMRTNYLKRLTHQENLQNQQKIKNIAKFFDVIWSFAQVATEDRVLHFVKYLDLLIEAGDDPGTAEADPDLDAVQVMTVHKSKGLEWPVVFMVSLVANKFPSIRRKDPIELPLDLVTESLPSGDAHLQEERRLFYVGMTRAKERLYFTSSVDHGGVRKRKVSPFILEALDRPKIEEVSERMQPEERIHRFAPPPEGLTETMAPMADSDILNLSHYQIDDYQTCPLKYKYIHILRLPFFHHTLVYGKAVHAAVEIYYLHKMKDFPVALGDLYEAYHAAWRNIGFLSREHEERRYEAGKAAIQRFYEREESLGVIPQFVETPFQFMMGKNRIAGRWDRIDSRNGKIYIVDFKTSEVYQQEAADKRTKQSLQLTIYAMAYEYMYKQKPDGLELQFLESGLVGRAAVSQKMQEKAEKNINEAAAGIRKRDYSAKPGYNSCRFCAYTEICPSAIKT